MEKQNGNYYSIWGLYRDNGKENGSYRFGFRVVNIRSFGSLIPLGT